MLVNDGTPTTWDCRPFEKYRDSKLRDAPAAVGSLTRSSRLSLDGDETLWMAEVLAIGFGGTTLTLKLAGRWQSRVFLLEYKQIARVSFTRSHFQFPPALVIQELTRLKAGWWRHVWSDLAGDRYEIVFRRLEFSEAASALQ